MENNPLSISFQLDQIEKLQDLLEYFLDHFRLSAKSEFSSQVQATDQLLFLGSRSTA